jgi:hypothetical protein
VCPQNYPGSTATTDVQISTAQSEVDARKVAVYADDERKELSLMTGNDAQRLGVLVSAFMASVGHKLPRVRIDAGGGEHVVHPVIIGVRLPKQGMVYRAQLSVQLGYAITIHKATGMVRITLLAATRAQLSLLQVAERVRAARRSGFRVCTLPSPRTAVKRRARCTLRCLALRPWVVCRLANTP